MALNIPMPDSPGDSLLKGLTAGSNLMHNMMLNKYYGQLHPSGDVANALYVENLRHQFGENDPRYLEAKRAHDMQMKARDSLIGYRDTLNQTAGLRATTPLGKTIAEGKGQGAQDILNRNQGGARPVNGVTKEGEQWYDQEGNPVYGDDNPRTPEERKAYEQAIAKGTTDAAVRNQLPFAKNVEITLDSINPDDLVQYSGPKGHVKLGLDMLKAANGNPSEEFLKYNDALSAAKMGSKQLRQFWKDSIQPSAREAIESLVNPSTWSKNPEVAKRQFEQLRALTKQELQTFRQAGTSPIKLGYDKKTGSFYTDQQGAPKSSLEQKVTGSGNKFSISQEDKNMANVASGQFIDVLPKATSEAIIQTAIATRRPVGDVIDHLAAQAARMRGGQ